MAVNNKTGAVTRADQARLFVRGKESPVQGRILAYWPDRSVKWLLLVFPLDGDGGYGLTPGTGEGTEMAFTVIALFAVANTALLNCVTGSRLLYGMSRQGLLPAWLSVVHHRTQTPHRSTAVVLLAALLLAVCGTMVELAGTTSTLLLVCQCSYQLLFGLITWRNTGQMLL